MYTWAFVCADITVKSSGADAWHGHFGVKENSRIVSQGKVVSSWYMHLKQVGWLILWQSFLHSVDYKNWSCLAQMLRLILQGSKLEEYEIFLPCFWSLGSGDPQAVWWGSRVAEEKSSCPVPLKNGGDECCAVLASMWLEDVIKLYLNEQPLRSCLRVHSFSLTAWFKLPIICSLFTCKVELC